VTCGNNRGNYQNWTPFKSYNHDNILDIIGQKRFT